jgi:hypothetical protein
MTKPDRPLLMLANALEDINVGQKIAPQMSEGIWDLACQVADVPPASQTTRKLVVEILKRGGKLR